MEDEPHGRAATSGVRQRIDLVVNLSVELEVKATEHLPPMSHRQLLSYLRATHL